MARFRRCPKPWPSRLGCAPMEAGRSPGPMVLVTANGTPGVASRAARGHRKPEHERGGRRGLPRHVSGRSGNSVRPSVGGNEQLVSRKTVPGHPMGGAAQTQRIPPSFPMVREAAQGHGAVRAAQSARKLRASGGDSRSDAGCLDLLEFHPGLLATSLPGAAGQAALAPPGRRNGTLAVRAVMEILFPAGRCIVNFNRSQLPDRG
jgi:hypothetical protein